MKLRRTTAIPGDLEQVWSFFSDAGNLARITPRSMRFSIVSSPERDLRAGDLLEYRVRIFGISLGWLSKIEEWTPRSSFVDRQLRGPYRYWRHRHSFAESQSHVTMVDEVDYELPLGLPGRIFGRIPVERQLQKIFDHRSRAIMEIFGSA